MAKPKRELTIEDIGLDEEWLDAHRIQTHIFEPRWYLNGFPKAGTHLLTSMMKVRARKMPPSQLHPREWVGTFNRNSWSDEWISLRPTMYHFGSLLPGYYFLGHCGYDEELERFLFNLGIAHVFIWRDLRDVAVSQAHHILDEDRDNWKHQHKDEYREEIGGFDEVLTAVIKGAEVAGLWYPGVIDRWELYAPWLDVEWVYDVKYRDAREDPKRVAGEIAKYGIWRLADTFSLDMLGPGPDWDELVEGMAEASRDTEHSGTFRRGVAGGWRDEFKPEHVEAFKEADEAGWLVKLGFEESNDWTL